MQNKKSENRNNKMTVRITDKDYVRFKKACFDIYQPLSRMLEELILRALNDLENGKGIFKEEWPICQNSRRKKD
jgi:hypothetical protein